VSNVTFIIGNGLDISLKLNTTYRNFYSYVKKNNLHPNNNIYKAIHKENPNHWADFELGLGRYTKRIEDVPETERESWSLRLNDELDEIKIDLKNYIQEQNSYADDHIPKIQFDHDSFLQGLAAGQVSKIRQFMPRNKQTAIRIITLNYTDVLEKLFPNAGRAVLGPKYAVIDKIHHVHGSIEGQISLGVNDETQISSYIVDDEKKFLIKPELIHQMNDGRLETLAKYINLSNIIVLFGLSLGATDKYIWSQVAQWLNSHPNNILVIHHYESGLKVSELTERQALLLDDRVKNKFLDHSDIDESIKSSLKLKIYIVPNTKSLFSISKDQ
jgi:hypothetical protein